MKSMRPSFRKEGRDGCRKNTGFLWKQTDPSVQPIEALTDQVDEERRVLTVIGDNSGDFGLLPQHCYRYLCFELGVVVVG